MSDVCFSGDFSNISPQARGNQEKINKRGYIKQTILHSKTFFQIKRQLDKEKMIFADTCNKGLILKNYFKKLYN